jgi:hypothetical protein
LGDKQVQTSVEGRFCDSAISVREAALELVGRHIASHPDVGFKVCVNGSFLNWKKKTWSCLTTSWLFWRHFTIMVVELLKQFFQFCTVVF